MAMAITTAGSTRAPAGRVNDPVREVPERARRRQYSAKYKLETLAEYDSLDRDAKGALLRREALYTSLLSGGGSSETWGAEALDTSQSAGRTSAIGQQTALLCGRPHERGRRTIVNVTLAPRWCRSRAAAAPSRPDDAS